MFICTYLCDTTGKAFITETSAFVKNYIKLLHVYSLSLTKRKISPCTVMTKSEIPWFIYKGQKFMTCTSLGQSVITQCCVRLVLLYI